MKFIININILLFLFSIPSLSQQPELILKKGYRSQSNTVIFSNDGRFLVTAEDDKTIKIWDIEKRQLFKELVGTEDIVSYAAFTNDDKYIISSGWDGTIRKWDINTGKEAGLFDKYNSGILFAALSPNDKYVIGVCRDHNIVLWDVNTGLRLNTFGKIESEYLGINWISESEVITSSSDNLIRLWDPELGKLINRFEANKIRLSAMGCSQTGNFVCSSGYDTTFKLWDLKTLTNYATINTPGCIVTTFCSNKEGTLILAGTENNLVKVYESKSGNEIMTFYGHKNLISSVAISNDGLLAASYSNDRTIKIWNMQTGKEITTLSGNRWIISSVAFFDRGRKIVSSSYEGSIKIWDLETGDGTKTIKLHDLPITSLSISHDNKYILTSSYDETLKLFDIKSEKVVQTFAGHTHIVSCAAFSPDDKYIISGSYDKSLILWNTESGTIVRSFNGHRGFINSVCFSPGGDTVISGANDSCINYWDVNTGILLHSSWGHKRAVNTVTYSHDGRYTVSGGSDNRIVVWDVKSYNVVSELYGHDWHVSDLEYSKDNRYIVSSSYDESIIRWDTRRNNEIKQIHAHQNVVSSLSISDSNRFIVTGSWDGTIKLWNIDKMELIATLIPIEENDYIIALPNGYYMGSKNGIKSILFKIEGSIYPFEQFDIAFNRPDLVLSEIGFASKERIQMLRQSYDLRLKKLNLTHIPFFNEWNLPEIGITNKNEIKPYTKNSTLNISVRAEDKKRRLVRLKIYVNEVPLFGKLGMDIFGPDSFIYEHTLPIELSAGLNKIKVSVVNESGEESLSTYIETYYESPRIDEKPNLFAISIGISNYKDTVLNLQYAASDANDFAKFLNNNKEHYSSINVFPLIDNEATKTKILKLKKFLNSSEVNDEVIIYVAGQGIIDKKFNYYFATYDINYLKPRKKGLSIEELENLFDGIKARKRILLLNTSNSGEIDTSEIKKENNNIDCATISEHGMAGIVKSCKIKGAYKLQKNTAVDRNNSIEFLSDLFVDLRIGSGAIIIASSSGAYEFPYTDEEWHNGVFTYALMDGLKNSKADNNDDGIVTISELRDYIISTVKELTYNMMKPTVRKELIDNDFAIWK